MHGSLTCRNGVLYVGRHHLTAHVRPYDFDGRALGEGFAFRGDGGEPARVSGLAADRDHLLWIADGARDVVEPRTVMGLASGVALGRHVDGEARAASGDARGRLGRVVDVALVARDEDAYDVLVASGGERRHALQLFRPNGTLVLSLRPEGDPLGTFHGLTRCAALGRTIWACERRAQRVQVFRDLEHHFSFRVPRSKGGTFEPWAVAPLEDGGALLACGGPSSALLHVDVAGRLVQVLAEAGTEDGRVRDPEALCVERDAVDGPRRVAVMDRDGERVQVFTLGGRCYGALDDLPGAERGGRLGRTGKPS